MVYLWAINLFILLMTIPTQQKKDEIKQEKIENVEIFDQTNKSIESE